MGHLSYRDLLDYIGKLVDKRVSEPNGDLISKIVTEQVSETLPSIHRYILTNLLF